MLDPDDCIMDFKAEEKKTHSFIVEFESMDSDSNTISASEATSPTPALLCKLRKARVRIKKLPPQILEKYNLNMKKSSKRYSPTPSRVSRRLGGKSVPGHYLSLHVNKPLNKVINKKKRQKENVMSTKHSKILDQHRKCSQILRIKEKNIVNSSSAKISRTTNTINAPSENTITTSFKSLPDSLLKNSEFMKSNLCEKLANTRKINPGAQTQNSVASINLPKLPDVIITRYELPPDSSSKTGNVASAVTSNIQNTGTSYSVVKPSPITTKHQPHAFPIIISSMNRLNETPHQPPTISSVVNLQQQRSKTKHLSTSIQTITIPPIITNNKHDALITDSSMVMPMKQPTNRMDNLLNKEILISASDSDTNSESESEVEVLDNANKQPQQEIIKRIILHTKSVQTKFTCPSNICGLIDSDEFNLNCFYCYDIFPLHKWLEFKQHIKLVHHVEEKTIQSDSEDASNDEIQDISTTTTKNLQSIQTIDLNSKSNPTITFKKTSPEAIAHETEKLATELKKNKDTEFDDIISLDSLDSNDDDFIDINKTVDNKIADDVHFKTMAPNRERVKEFVNGNVNTNHSKMEDVAKLLPPSLSHITIKKVVTSPSYGTENCKQTASEGSPMKKSFVKIPSNFNIKQIIKSLPKPKSEQLNANGEKRPRYFVVKKILKPATTDKKPNIKISQGSILTKMSESSKVINWEDDDMPSNAENEDDIPKPTNGCGIIFGITNRMVVIEFLLKLKSFPILWRPPLLNGCKENYDLGIKAMCEHLNNRFELNIQEYEMRLSIPRVKTWYSRTLNKIHEHNKNCNNSEPYRHTFPLYFKILNQFLTSDIRSKNNITKPLNKTISPPKKPMESATKQGNASLSLERNAIPSVSLSLPNEENQQENIDSSQNLIEFDGDTFYEFESSDDEDILKEFDDNNSNDKSNKLHDSENKPRRTRIYLGKFECDICKKVFKRICDLKRHKVHHFPPQFECAVCSQKFYFKCWAERCNHLKKKYMNVSTEENVDDSTSSSANERVVVKPKRIWPKKIFRFKMICEICGASYRSIGSLNSHKRDKHLNQRLKCIVCNFTALTNYRIVQHQKKRHIVEPGTVEEVAKKSRARMDTKTPFSTEARQEFDWRREMRAKLKPGEIFYGCCKCRIVFNTRKEKVLHNKMEHPIKETTVVCLLCLPNKLLLSNSNGARRHYTDIHKVPWDEIDALVKRTKPIFNILSKEEIELLNASENYKELLEELLKDREIEPKLQKVEIVNAEDEALNVVPNFTYLQDTAKEQMTSYKVDVEYNEEQQMQEAEAEEEEQQEQVFIDGIIDHDYNNEEIYRNDEHSYSEEQLEVVETNNQEFEAYNIDCNEAQILTQEQNDQQQQNDQEYMQNVLDKYMEDELVEGDLIEECIVVEEECIDDIVEEEYY
ncbi:uncharacterized protein ACRADG_011424 [Cochliomyia hominivorax]